MAGTPRAGHSRPRGGGGVWGDPQNAAWGLGVGRGLVPGSVAATLAVALWGCCASVSPFCLMLSSAAFRAFGVRRGEKLRVRPARCLGESWGARSAPPKPPPTFGGHLGHFPFPKTQREVKQERGCARGAAPAGQVPGTGDAFLVPAPPPPSRPPPMSPGTSWHHHNSDGRDGDGDMEGCGCARGCKGGALRNATRPSQQPRGCRCHRLLLVPLCRGQFSAPWLCSAGTPGAVGWGRGRAAGGGAEEMRLFLAAGACLRAELSARAPSPGLLRRIRAVSCSRSFIWARFLPAAFQ